ncbi:MAG TPA: prepilin-type N-terminal cleavage/methylation domain-containing protein [Candidatus Polarisedimenticolaceae bacterium]|nr:prepilin-type N-terminal cleavage/methylation domain-containing protein [Candidatus Polarisedimenticolaceae bacterium]
MKRNAKGFTLIELLIVVAIIGIIAAIAIPNLLNAIDRGKQKRTMADMRSIGTAIESYSVDFSHYPQGNLAQVTTVLEPVYIKKMPATDGWRNPIQINSVADTGYTVESYAKGGANNTDISGATQNFSDDIVFVDGQFVSWPEGQQK